MNISRKAKTKALVTILLISAAGAACANGGRERYGYGYGMMGNGYGPGMMGRGYGYGMMDGYYGPGMAGLPEGYPGASRGLVSDRLTLEDAKRSVLEYLNALGAKNLAVDEVMEFDRNFYALVKEKDSGVGAFELLVDPYRGYVSPEPGPNMMWNVKYGHMAWRNGTPDRMPVDVARARELAQKSLDEIGPGFTVEERPDVFYGYYTAHILKDGKIVGMLSINGYSGGIWFHSWHGAFRAMEKED